MLGIRTHRPNVDIVTVLMGIQQGIEKDDWIVYFLEQPGTSQQELESTQSSPTVGS